MTTGIPGDHLARFQAALKRINDRVYEIERRVGARQTGLQRKPKLPPGAQLYTGEFNVAHNTNVTTTGHTVAWDSGGVGSTDRITVPAGQGGIWSVTFELYWPYYQFPNSTDVWNFTLYRYTAAGDVSASWPGADQRHNKGRGMSLQVKADAGHYFQVIVYQFSGATRTAQVTHFGGFQVRPY